MSEKSPKFSVPWIANSVRLAADRLRINTDGFEGLPFAAVGGLSTAWGAGVSLFDSEDMSGWPISPEDLSSDYSAVAEKIGVTGEWPHDCAAPADLRPHPGLHPTARLLLDRTKPRSDFGLGIGLRAVLGRDRPGRSACSLDGSCLFGCSRNSIWSAAFEVQSLKALAHFELLSELRVERIEQNSPYWQVHCENGVRIRARYVVLAAGAVGSARLALPLLHMQRAPVRLLSSPMGAFLLFVPSRLGAPWETRGFGLAQLYFRQNLPADSDYAFGALFAAEGIPLRFLLARLPARSMLGLKVLRELVPACLLGNIFFNGRHSRHVLSVEADGRVTVSGGHGSSLGYAVGAVVNRLRLNLFRLGGVLLPYRPEIGPPGADMHLAGTLPMRESPERGTTDRWGALSGLPGLAVLDASVLPTLPPKGHTLTVMANARRISRHWAEHWR